MTSRRQCIGEAHSWAGAVAGAGGGAGNMAQAGRAKPRLGSGHNGLWFLLLPGDKSCDTSAYLHWEPRASGGVWHYVGMWVSTGSATSAVTSANHRQETWIYQGCTAWLGLLPGYLGYRPSWSPRSRGYLVMVSKKELGFL